MQLFGLESNLDINETRKKIEQNRIQLEALINSEDSTSVAIQEFKKQVDRLNQIVFEVNSQEKIDSDTLLEKSKKLIKISTLLFEAANKYQESFSKNLFRQVKHLGLWYQGTAKKFEIYAVVKSTTLNQSEQMIQFVKLWTDFIENYWESHPEEILEKEEWASRLVKLDLSSMSNNLREVNDKFIETALSAAEKVRLKEIENYSSSVQKILDWVIHSPGWQGEDFEDCLEIVKNSRNQAEF